MNSTTIHFKGKNQTIPIKRVSLLGKFTGLMFRTRETQNLLFEFHREMRIALHSWFVFFPFLVLWVNEKNEVLESRVIRPFSTVIDSSQPFRKIIEIPFSRRNKGIIRFFVGNKKI